MADEKKPDAKPAPAPEKDHVAELIWFLLAIFLFISFITALINYFDNNKLFSFGWKGLSPSGIMLSLTKPISSLLNPIGSKFVVTSNNAPLYDSPGGKQIGTKKVGDKGTIVGGPVTIGSDKYWQVKFEDGSTGWMLEKDIANLPQQSIPMKDIPTLVGTPVETSVETPVYAEPGVDLIATEKAGAKATIIEGPIFKDGVKYWHVKFEDGKEGWVPESNLNSLKIEKQPLSAVSNPKGGKVSVSKGPTDLFSEPGKNKIASEPVGAVGEVVDGPQTVNGVKYWKVKFEDGKEGWVAEDSMDYLKISKTPLKDMPSIIGGNVSTNKNGTPLYDSPGGKQLKTLNKGTSGKIIEGPLVKDGVKYWHVKFDNGDEGWVSENDLDYIQDTQPSPLVRFMSAFWKLVTYVKYILLLISLVFLGWVVYLYKGLSAARLAERMTLYPEGLPENVSEKPFVNQNWERILKNIESLNENDWRLAIIEADIMLGELLDKFSLTGESIGEKLKQIEKSDFTTIENAWEAHKVRNQIAHDGPAFQLNQRETRRIIDLYRSVFEEFKMI